MTEPRQFGSALRQSRLMILYNHCRQLMMCLVLFPMSLNLRVETILNRSQLVSLTNCSHSTRSGEAGGTVIGCGVDRAVLHARVVSRHAALASLSVALDRHRRELSCLGCIDRSCRCSWDRMAGCKRKEMAGHRAFVLHRRCHGRELTSVVRFVRCALGPFSQLHLPRRIDRSIDPSTAPRRIIRVTD
jgi:hypothetical protein